MKDLNNWQVTKKVHLSRNSLKAGHYSFPQSVPVLNLPSKRDLHHFQSIMKFFQFGLTCQILPLVALAGSVEKRSVQDRGNILDHR